MPNDLYIKIVLIGNSTAGKSCLVNAYINEQFNAEHVPTVLAVMTGKRKYGQRNLNIEVHDTAGDDNLGVHRSLNYNGTDCFVICCSMENESQLETLQKWITEVKNVEA